MEKLTRKTRNVLFAIVSIFFMGFAFLLAGCQSSIFRGISEGGYSINRLIYTDNVAKYIQGKVLLEGEIKWNAGSGSSTTTLNFEKIRKAGVYVCLSDNHNTVDLVMSTVKPEGATEYSPMIGPILELSFLSALPTMAGDPFVSINGDRANGFYPLIPFNSQKLFIYDDLYYEMLEIGFNIVKEEGSSCTCGTYAMVDTSNYYCGCGGDQVYDGTYSAEGKCLTSSYYPNINLATVPNCCYVVTEIFETDEETGEQVSTNTFKVESRCTGRLAFEFTEPTIRNYVGQVENSFGGHIGFPPIEELVVDGFSLDNYKQWFYTLIGPATSSKYFSEMGIEQYFDFNDFSGMFQGLPCKKVTLNNITGFEDFEIHELSHMFANCENLVEVDFGNFFEGHQPTDISYMFFNCPNLSKVDLSSLDTSKVEDMSYMFYSNPTRDQIVSNIINEQLIPLANSQGQGEIYPPTDNGKPWTWDTATMFMINMDEGLQQQYQENPENTFKMIKTEILFMCYEMGFLTKIGLTYDEVAMFVSDFVCMTFAEFVDYVNEDPSIWGLEAKENGKPYTQSEIKTRLKAIAAEENIFIGTENAVANYYYGKAEVVYQGYQEKYIERDDYMQQVIASNVASGSAAVAKTSAITTWEDYALNFIQNNQDWKTMYDSDPETTLAKAKIQVVFNMFESGELKEFALSYDEVVAYITEYQILTLEAGVEAVNENPASFGLSAKEDATPYTEEEIKNLILIKLGSICLKQKVGITVGSADEVEVMKIKYLTEIAVDERQLVLGGEDSKFIIENDMETTNMFASRFDTLVAPNVAEGVSIDLGGEYETTDGEKYTTLTSHLSNIKMNLVDPPVEEPEEPEEPEDPVDPNPGEGGEGGEGGDPNQPTDPSDPENPVDPEDPQPNPPEEPEDPNGGETSDPEETTEQENKTIVLVAAILLGCLVVATGCVAVASNRKSSLRKKRSIFEIIMNILKRKD